MSKAMKLFVTGASGFVGRHLVTELLSRGHMVIAGTHTETVLFPSSVTKVKCDLFNVSELYYVLESTKPDVVVHLASKSSVIESWSDPISAFSVNTIGTINLIQAIKESTPKAKIITVGSSEEYGLTAKTEPILREIHPCYPQNPYAVSKFAMGQTALQLGQKENLQLIHVRPFNHFGPGQKEGFVISDFSAQIARMEAGLSPPVIKVGNLKV